MTHSMILKQHRYYSKLVTSPNNLSKDLLFANQLFTAKYTASSSKDNLQPTLFVVSTQ